MDHLDLIANTERMQVPQKKIGVLLPGKRAENVRQARKANGHCVTLPPCASVLSSVNRAENGLAF